MALTDASELDTVKSPDLALWDVVARLAEEFEARPLEDGTAHPAERIVAEHLDSLACEAPDRLMDELEAKHGADFCASLVQCLGRCEIPPSVALTILSVALSPTAVGGAVNAQNLDSWTLWKQQLLAHCLASKDIVVRDAAIQAAEDWEDPAMYSILSSHVERVPWLRDYLSSVTADLASR